MGLTRQEQIKRIHQSFVENFTNGMRSIKPTDRTDPEFGKKYEAWQSAFAFPKRLHIEFANFADHIVYAGNNSQGGPDTEFKVLPEFIDNLNKVLNDGDFDEYMNIAKPNIPTDTDYDEKVKAWKKAFEVANKIQGFTKDVKIAIDASPARFITSVGYYSYIISLINRLESN